MSIRKAFNIDGIKTYASYANAEKAFCNACKRVGLSTDTVTDNTSDPLNFVIAATNEGRFYPVALPNADQVQLTLAMMHTSNVCLFRH